MGCWKDGYRDSDEFVTMIHGPPNPPHQQFYALALTHNTKMKINRIYESLWINGNNPFNDHFNIITPRNLGKEVRKILKEHISDKKLTTNGQIIDEIKIYIGSATKCYNTTKIYYENKLIDFETAKDILRLGDKEVNVIVRPYIYNYAISLTILIRIEYMNIL